MLRCEWFVDDLAFDKCLVRCHTIGVWGVAWVASGPGLADGARLLLVTLRGIGVEIVTDVLDKLKAARQAYADQGYVNVAIGDYDGETCLVGHMARVYEFKPGTWDFDGKTNDGLWSTDDILRFLAKVDGEMAELLYNELPEHAQRAHEYSLHESLATRQLTCLYIYNDGWNRTLEEILALFDGAIAKLEPANVG